MPHSLPRSGQIRRCPYYTGAAQEKGRITVMQDIVIDPTDANSVMLVTWFEPPAKAVRH